MCRYIFQAPNAKILLLFHSSLPDLITFAYLYSKFSSLHPYLKDIILYFYDTFKVLLFKFMTVELKFILGMVLDNQILLLFNKGSRVPQHLLLRKVTLLQ